MSRHGLSTGRDARRRLRRAGLLTVGTLALTTLAVVTPAQATPPANDTWQAATPVTGLPFTATVDTSEATADAGFGRYRFHAVWYHVVLASDARLYLTTKGSSFTPLALRVYHADAVDEPPADWEVVAGDRTWSQRYPAGLVTAVEGGQHYYVMIGTSSEGAGGVAKLTVRRPARLILSLSPTGRVSKVDGSAVIRGTLRTTRPASVRLQTYLRQLVGDRVVKGSSSLQVAATTETRPWSMRISAGRSFKTGPARIVDDRIWLYDDGLRVGVYRFPRRVVTLQ